MKDLLPDLLRLWLTCRPIYDRLPLADQVSMFSAHQAARVFAGEQLGGAQKGFIDDMVWEAVRKSGTHTDDEIATARGSCDGSAVRN